MSKKIDERAKNLGAVIRSARHSTGLSLEEFAPKVKVSRAALGMYERGESVPEVDFLDRLSRSTGADLTGLLQARLLASGIEGIQVILPAAVGGTASSLTDGAAHHSDGEFVPVSLYDIRAAAGAGALVEREKVETEVAFRADWLHALGVAADRLAVIRAVGNSMEPTICHGDALLLELEPERLIEGAVYVIAREDELLIKRPQKLGSEGLVLLSDNPDYRPVTYSPEEAGAMRIVGRVRWIGRVL